MRHAVTATATIPRPIPHTVAAMSQFWSQTVHRLTPYVPGEQPALPDLVKLNTNENPYPPSPAVLAALHEALGEDAAALRLYPDPDATLFKATIAEQFPASSITPAQVFVGNGSDEVLAHVFMALLQHDRPLLTPDIGYSFYPAYCQLYGIDCVRIPLDDEFTVCIDDYLAPQCGCGAIILANPNAPTGRLLPQSDIERLARAHPDIPVVIDEAYIDFSGETIAEIPTAVPLIKHLPNLLIIRTLSKSYSLAGLRIGYAIGQAPLIEALDRVKNSFNSYPLDRLAIAGGTAALRDRAHFDMTRRAVMQSREWLIDTLRGLEFEVLPSATNFIFARHPRHDAAHIAASLRASHILVRHFKQPRIEQYLRISIGTDTQCRALADALSAIVNASGGGQ